ncbi:MAG TPA: hypothetical protein VFA97_01715 [Gaiellaceae bacterium]|nr:hypothetical protein [Gaiellaceae bacterium]
MTRRNQVAVLILLACLLGFVTACLFGLLAAIGIAGAPSGGSYPSTLIVAAGVSAFATLALLVSAALLGRAAIRQVGTISRAVTSRATTVVLLGFAATSVMAADVFTANANLAIIGDLLPVAFVVQSYRLVFFVHRAMPDDAPRSTLELSTLH